MRACMSARVCVHVCECVYVRVCGRDTRMCATVYVFLCVHVCVCVMRCAYLSAFVSSTDSYKMRHHK